MFGLLYYFFIGLFKIFYDAYANIVSAIRRVRGLNGDGTGFGYVDYHGRFRDRVTNKHAYLINSTGTFEDYKGNVLYDPNIERIEKYREENRREAIEKGRSTYVWLKSGDVKNYDKDNMNIYGNRYKDIITGEIYVAREIENEQYYVNIITGELVRLTDYGKKFREKHPIKCDIIFNSKEKCVNNTKDNHDKYLYMRDGLELYEG